MALTERTRLYEVLIRIHADGTSGSHSQNITEIVRDDEVISSLVEPPIPLPTADLKALVASLPDSVA